MGEEVGIITGVAKPVRLLPPEEWVSRQLGNLEAVGETNYRQRIKMPKKDPIAAGIAAEGKYNAQMKKVLAEKRRAKALEFSNIDVWYTFADVLGAPRLVEGVTKRAIKVRRFVGNWAPLLSKHLAEIDKLPVETDAEREKKMLQNLRGLKALHGEWLAPYK